MYEPYPDAKPPQDPVRVPQPRTVRDAVRLIYVGAALEVLAIVAVAADRSEIRQSVLKLARGGTALLAIDVVGWLAGTGAIVLLFSRQSRPFFRPGSVA